MDNITNVLKVWARNDWIYWAYSKVKFNIQKHINDTFEATQIIDNLWLGSLESSCNRDALQEKNIETVISAVLGASAMYPFDFRYERAKLKDVEDENILDEFDKLLPIIRKELVNNRGVLCHCHAGRSRSASIVAAYLIKYNGMSTDEALNYIKARRTQVDPNAGYIQQLRQFEDKVKLEKNYEISDDKKIK